VANEGSVKTLARVFSEGRKFRMSMMNILPYTATAEQVVQLPCCAIMH
jgi:hypothetical protein